ncbi:MAG: hypothetical protein JO127_08695 [Caulobacteraceae bacterium]|nr:hypothetical protein [Caulobacteraceae bacterium]
MNDHLDIKGASGATYRFMRFKEGRPLSPAGGNFLFGRYTGSRFELLYAGEVQNLLKDARSKWQEAVERYQASTLFTRLNISERVRQVEHDDIVKAHEPPMNEDPEAPAHTAANLTTLVVADAPRVPLLARREGAEATAPRPELVSVRRAG